MEKKNCLKYNAHTVNTEATQSSNFLVFTAQTRKLKKKKKKKKSSAGLGSRCAHFSEVESSAMSGPQKLVKRQMFAANNSAGRDLKVLTYDRPSSRRRSIASAEAQSLEIHESCSVWRRAVRCVAGADWQAEVAPILKNHRLTSIEHRWALQFAVVERRCVQKSAPLSCAQD